ncbi:MAG TPA: hypothetical protein VMW75_12275, partial [Thermoanaerobaculia bacterium]|nr:hypothetical protein [Thermoanaerobaculia bacterium]
MRLGVVEWVTVEDRWGGMGEPFPGFCGNLLTPDAGTPILPRQAQAVRAACFGFRLLWRENAGSADLPDDERRS